MTLRQEEQRMSIPFSWSMGENRVIRGDYHPSKGSSQGILIVCHGFKGFKDWGFFPYACDQLAAKLDVVSFNFSHNGVGESLQDFSELDKFGRNTYSRELEDLAFVVDAVSRGKLPESPDVDGLPVYLLGHSRGAGDCLLYAFEHPYRVSGIVSWNGITDVDLFSEEDKENMRTKGRTFIRNARTRQDMPLDREILEDLEQNQERFDILKRAQESSIAVLLVQGTEDSIRFREGSEVLMSVRPDIIRHSIPGGNHTFQAVHPFQGTTPQLEEAIKRTCEWIAEQIRHSS